MKKKLAIRRKRSLLISTALYHIKDWKTKVPDRRDSFQAGRTLSLLHFDKTPIGIA